MAFFAHHYHCTFLDFMHSVAVFLRGRTATVLFTVCLFCSSFQYKSSAQTNEKPAEKPSNKPEKAKVEQPLELPEFVITGVESLDVPGGTKQAPKPPRKLSAQQLQTFNPLDKLSFGLLPFASAPTLVLPSQERNGFLKAEFGMFLTPSLEAGYRAVLGNFDINAALGGTLSNGHLPNADFSDLFARIHSSYLAGEQFLFFAGSRTDTYLRARRREYSFFGASNLSAEAIRRAQLGIDAGVQTSGVFEGWGYEMGVHGEFANIRTQEITNLPTTADNLAAKGNLLAKKLMGEWAIGGQIQAESVFISSRQDSVEAAPQQPFLLTPNLVVEFRSEQKTFEMQVRGGAHIWNDASFRANPAARITPHVSLNAALHPAYGVSVMLEAFSGVRLQTLGRIVKENPYAPFLDGFSRPRIVPNYTLFPNPLATQTLYDAQLSVRLQPSKHLSFTLGGRSEMNTNALLFGRNESNIGEIAVVFGNTSIHRVFGECSFLPDSNNALSVRANAVLSASGFVLSSSRPIGVVPYLAPIEAAVEYRRTWFSGFSTNLSAVLLGERKASIYEPSATLPLFVDVRFGVEYRFTPQFSVYARGTNLLNQAIFLWDGYQERGIFAAVGVVLTF